MTLASTIISALLILVGGMGVYGVWRISALRAANDTIRIMQARIDALEQRDGERDLAYKALENKCNVLQELVTNAAAVSSLAETMQAGHANIMARIEDVTCMVEGLVSNK